VKRRADRAEWRLIVERRFVVSYLETAEFTGYATLLLLDRFAEPFWVELDGQSCCVAADGFSWLQHFPVGERYTLTTMFDAAGDVVQWYLDVCIEHGVDEQGVPWFDDMYLDVVVSSSGSVHLVDADELADAARRGVVSRRDYDQAWAEARRLLELVARGALPLLALSSAHRSLLVRRLADQAARSAGQC
jgi:hypothetical protein